MKARWLTPAIVISFCSPGCADRSDSRSLMLRSATLNDPDFPDENEVKLVHFAHLGSVQTPSGTVHIVWQKAVIDNMLSPRGLRAIQYFNNDFEWIGRDSSLAIASYSQPPLFTKGSRLYFSGPLGGRDNPTGDGVEPAGNVLDFSSGFETRQLLYESLYGSWVPTKND